MPMPAKVTWAKTDGSKVLAIGGEQKSLFGRSSWKLTAEEAVRLMALDEWSFYVEVEGRQEPLALCAGPDGAERLSCRGPIERVL